MGCRLCSQNEDYIDYENLDCKINTNLLKNTILNIQQVNSFSILNQKKINKVIKPKVLKKKIITIPKPVQHFIYKQKEKCVCKIKINNSFGTGFFCNIPFPNNSNFLPVLITNNHILGENDITPESCINIGINDDLNKNEIYIGNNRLTFTDPYYDVTIIELKESDGLIIQMLEIDYTEYKTPLNEFKQLPIYIIHYPRSKNVCKSIGEINDISEIDLTIKHTCSTAPGSSGSPIINLNNLKVLGIHKGSQINENFNLGTFIKGPIEKFNDIHKFFSEVLEQKFFSTLKYTDFNIINIEGKEENDMCIIFMSFDYTILIALPCSSESLFAEIEKKLLDIYPKYKDKNKYYICNGATVKRFHSIKNNKIKDNDVVCLNIYEDD